MQIDHRDISTEKPPYIIAEISANHNGDINRAYELMAAAKAAGADAVKIQTYTPDIMTLDSDRPDFKIKGGLWDGYTLYDLYRDAHTPFEWHGSLFEKAKEIGMTIFSTPFDESAVDLLESLNAPAYKIASFEMMDFPLLKYVAKTKKPIIMSTGMASEEEIDASIHVLRDAGCEDLVVLHCVSGYPTPLEQAHVRTLAEIARRFDVLSGLSDHTLGVEAALAATALGATVIEKHFTLRREDGGHDAQFSLEPAELKMLCEQSQLVWAALGSASFDRKEVEKQNAVFRRSIYVVKDVEQGEAFSRENLRRIRPGYGLEPKYFDHVLGCRATMSIEAGTPLTDELYE